MSKQEDEISKKWEEIKPQIEEIIESRKQQTKTVWFIKPLAYAAAISFILIVTSVLILSNSTITTITQPNQTAIITLPDGSVATLNENTKLTYPKYNFWLKDYREIKLEGEAYFEIQKDSLKPFIIQSPHLTTTVLGTSFNLFDSKSALTSSLVVVEGKVRLTSHENKKNQIVEGGEEANYNKAHIVKKTSKNLNALAWKTKKLVFSKDPMLSVINTLQKYYKIKFIIKDKSILESQFSGTFQQPTLQQFLEVFEYTMDIQSSLKDQEVILNKK
ncbi:FecR family protein [Chondrinema litorale]|uniref:FecR family protein n=1 Tax=Chondrinema litorale TaxID=2994555 RepID=UPI0025435272|nr:FecR family protein [Chondrinema litorale]UZR97122.1 FecR family protein [Chondrinema litorale]